MIKKATNSAMFYAMLAQLAYRKDHEPNAEWVEKVPQRANFLIHHLQGTQAHTLTGIEFFHCWDKNSHYISIRGTDEVQDVFTDLLAAMKQPMSGPHGSKVAPVFWEGAAQIWNLIGDAVRESHADGRKVRVVGHSLGGSLAECLTSIMSEEDVQAYRLVTYGSPRCGDNAWSTWNRFQWAHLPREYRRYVNCRDPVPRFLWTKNYRHSVPMIYIDRNRGQHDSRTATNDWAMWKYAQIDRIIAWWNGVSALKCHKIESYIEALR